MRKIEVLSFVTLDGVMQAPGGPLEDTSGEFTYGGWTVPYFDAFAGEMMGDQMKDRSDLLLGRKTYEIFASYWPHHAAEWPGINEVNKYVVSSKEVDLSWKNSKWIQVDPANEIRKLKQEEGPDIQVHGSGNLIQTLLSNDLVDRLRLKIFPVTLGRGKRLFGSGTNSAAFKLISCKTSPMGVIFADYERDGELQTGSF